MGPDVVLVFRPEADARAVVQPEAPTFRLALRYLEPLTTPDALHALGIHVPTGHLQEAGDALVAVAGEGVRQSDHGRDQGVLVVAQLRSMPLAGAMPAERAASPAFGDGKPLTDRRDALAEA